MKIKILLKSIARKIKTNNCRDHKKSPILVLRRIKNYPDYIRYVDSQTKVYVERQNMEKQCIKAGNIFYTKAFCHTCGTKRDLITEYSHSFVKEDGSRIPNWREHLLCRRCRLNNRMRAAVQIFEQEFGNNQNLMIYLTERKTPLYRWMKEKYPNTQGSEYLGDAIPYGKHDKDGVRNETLTKLTWANQNFDLILSFDVFEHIPNYKRAFRECARVLKPNGKMLFTIPFVTNNRHNLIRARVGRDGKIDHLLPPEFHGDPLNQSGCLAFYHFGWELLDEIRTCGFAEIEALFYWSRELGYFGVDQMAFIAHVD